MDWKNLGKGFILYYISDKGIRIEYEGNEIAKHTVISNTVNGLYNGYDYIFAIRNPSYKERYSKPYEFIMINKNTHEQHKFSGWGGFMHKPEENDMGISDILFTFDKEDTRSCRLK